MGGGFANLDSIIKANQDAVFYQRETSRKNAIIQDITLQKDKLEKTSDPIEREKIEAEIARLGRVKADKVFGEPVDGQPESNDNELISKVIPGYEAKVNTVSQISDEKTRKIEENKLNQEILVSLQERIGQTSYLPQHEA